ncbi:glycosyltransferase [uncultured Marixanthomonas sp.]|uniref:glycosyltransferase n=1 Tax=uncultured Marixanthomonas sp. TaxID=757245 RepID=UPI0030DD3E6D|tara:strand:- start:56738 stop:57736 length:999 start_codon:yes stop_codon:yes gene_type:complete
MKKGVSIIMCVYNGRARLADTLSHLVNQKTTCEVEIVLVDNNSSDNTKSFADNWWRENGNPTIEYKSFFQPVPGKSYAQELGYEKAKYEYLLICDDDNWLCETYVQNAFDIMEKEKKIGALGGWCEAVFENNKPEWFDKYAKYFAVSKQGKESGDITNKKGCLYGAGMIIRKSHWMVLNNLGFKPLLTCRKGDALSSGGDTEYCYALRLLGYRIWYDKRLYFKHWMPKGRMKLSYIQRLRKAMSESNFIVSVYVDELKNREVTQKTFYKRAFRSLKNDFLKQSKKRLKGSFEEKEISKEYFRGLYRLITQYREYSKNRNSIKTWLPQNNTTK